MARSTDMYGSEGSVPTAQPTGLGAPQISAHASPEDFGSQIGAGVQKLGEAGEQLAAKYGQMVNENLMTQADVSFSTKLGQLKAGLTTKTGQAAYDAFPQYQKDVAQAFQDSRANLPLGAQHGFDMLAARSMANHIADGSTYATSQLKEGLRATGSDLSNKNIQAILGLSPEAAADKNRVDEHIGNAVYGLQIGMDENHPGLKTDPNTGQVNFDESTPEGKGLKAQYETGVNNIITQAQSNRFDVLAKNNPLGAFNLYQQERSSFPKQTQITLDSKFEPIVFNAHKDNAVSHAIAQSQDDYAKILYNPSSSDVTNKAIEFSLQHEGGYVPNDSGKGPTKYGINQESNPDVDVAHLTQAQAAKIMHDKYFLGVGADKMAPDMAMVASDTAVNMGVDKAKALVAKAGDDPQKLIDLRRAEYQRLATENPAHYGQYLDGWNKRLDDLQKTLGQPQKSYATNPDGSMFKDADYYRTHSEDVIAKGDVYADATMPGDLAFKRAVRETLTNYMSKVKSDQAGQYMLDNKNVMRGINGELTKSNPPATEQELRSIPGMNDLLTKVAAQSPEFYRNIPIMIGKMARRNDVTNSTNGYETILRVLAPEDNDNRIRNQDQLDRILGRSDGTGINAKDYNDAKPATELDVNAKTKFSDHMKAIANANGNLDGKGQERALAWYNQTMKAYKANEALGDKKDQKFVENIGKEDSGTSTEGFFHSTYRMLANMVGSKQAPTTSAAPTATGANGEKYILQGGQWVKQ